MSSPNAFQRGFVILPRKSDEPPPRPSSQAIANAAARRATEDRRERQAQREVWEERRG